MALKCQPPDDVCRQSGPAWSCPLLSEQCLLKGRGTDPAEIQCIVSSVLHLQVLVHTGKQVKLMLLLASLTCFWDVEAFHLTALAVV